MKITCKNAKKDAKLHVKMLKWKKIYIIELLDGVGSHARVNRVIINVKQRLIELLDGVGKLQ